VGFFIQNQQNQRKIERFVLSFYTLYTVNLCMGNIRVEAGLWITVFMAAALFAAWTSYFGKYKTYHARAAFTTVMMQITIILCVISSKDDKLALLPTFMVMTILVAFYGFMDILWVTLLSAFFIIFYHGVITESLELAGREAIVLLLPQVGNIICLEWVLHTWLKNRNENNTQIYKMIEALIEAEQSKDDFLSNVSHEIRTPVNTICGMSEMALREHDPEKMREEVFDIRDAGQNLMSLVSDILDFSQLQQGKMNLEEEAYNITSTINDIINNAMARKGDKPIELIVNCAADIPGELIGDEKKIRRVIMNLVDNAIKFTNEGGVIINISARKENYGVNLCISVKDTGIGISEESLEKIFECFSQVDTRRNRQEGGVGLGLAISKALVVKMGGTITVRSHLGRGSVFRFVVPQKVSDEEAIGQLENREKLNIATYFDMEQFDMMAIRDEYSELIVNMVRQLRVRCHACRNLAELKRRERIEPFTHIFISIEEYQEDEAYFDELAKLDKVILVIERYNEKYIKNPDIIRLYKPFYILPVVSILNGSTDSEGGLRMVRPGKFIAPEVHALVVDDNRMNIRVIEGLLKEYQIKVSYATSGQEALKVIERMCYDFVFMDHMMPEMDGVETLHRIRDKAGNYYQRVPIIALTANAAPGNREMFLEEGFDDFVAKPVELSVLERVLRRNLPEEKLIFVEKQGHMDTDSAIDVERKAEEGVQEDGHAFIVGDLDVEKGILYCGGKEKYLNILKAYYEEGEENCRYLDELYRKQDWDNYVIKVHALKSTMKSIGAIRLSEMAKALEKAGKERNLGYISAHHEEMVAEHGQVMAELEASPYVCPQKNLGQPVNAAQEARIGREASGKETENAVQGAHPQEAGNGIEEASGKETENGVQGAHPQDMGEGTEEASGKEAENGVQGVHPQEAENGIRRASGKAEPEGLDQAVQELDEEGFDGLLAELEDAMYALDGEEMLSVLARMQEYCYCGTSLRGKLDPVRKKVEMADYMSAVDVVSQLRSRLKTEAGHKRGASDEEAV